MTATYMFSSSLDLYIYIYYEGRALVCAFQVMSNNFSRTEVVEIFQGPLVDKGQAPVLITKVKVLNMFTDSSMNCSCVTM